MRKFMAILICLATLCAAINPAFAATIDNDVIYEERIIGVTFVDPEVVGTTYHSDGIMTMDFYNEIPIVSKTFPILPAIPPRCLPPSIHPNAAASNGGYPGPKNGRRSAILRLCLPACG